MANDSGNAPSSGDGAEKTQTMDPIESIPVNSSENDVDFKAGKRELLILGTMTALNVILSLDATVLPPVLPTLAKDLNGTTIETFWTGSSYLLANAVFVPFLGAVSDLFGRRAVLLFSLIMFTVGTIISCLATNFTELLCGRTIQGIGGGGIYTLSYIVVSDIIPLRQRPKYISFILSGWALGTIVGPITGGLVAEHAQWQWIFYINFPFCFLGLLVLPFAFRDLKLQNQPTFLTALSRVDWIGSILFIAGTSSILIGLTWGGVQYEWSSYQTWLPILLGGITTVCSVVYECYIPAKPFIHLSVWGNISACLVFLLGLFAGFTLYSHLYYLPFYLISVKGLSTTLTGVYIMATTALIVPISIISGRLMARFGSFLWSIWLGFACLIVSNGVLLLMNQYRSLVAHLFLILTISLGHGFTLLSPNIAIQAIAPARDVAYAVSMYVFVRQFGICLGVAVGGTVFDNVLLRALERAGFSHEVALATARNASAFSGQLNAMSNGPQKTAFLNAFVEAFHGVLYLLLALAAFSLVLSLFVKHHDMNKQLESDHQLEGGIPTNPA
ncbi:MFS general substrate transporter [Annulohypoxylon truncatum]|uniref:MFS general substrate transporter n=1 Tax=Annulohypoxylon truncatum TaxID=327061 RepID=UPI0020088B48|nr:MFS general substrate transporter [Annulohypoxylon truncatum]KAI1211605.1 MFS general substrate transporter [Annulohypoxylon truncatum]